MTLKRLANDGQEELAEGLDVDARPAAKVPRTEAEGSDSVATVGVSVSEEPCEVTERFSLVIISFQGCSMFIRRIAQLE